MIQADTLTYLRGALPLDGNEPKKQTLLRKADQHFSIYLEEIAASRT